MIVVFGSLNMDMVMQVEQMPRPGETVLCSRYQMIAGGKGANQAVAAARAGSTVKLFGKVGDDEFGRLIVNSLQASDIDLLGVGISKQSSTGCAAITVDAFGENMITVASGANLEAKEKDIPNFLLSSETILLLQMETPVEENWQLIERAKRFGAKIILNLAPAHPIPHEVLQKVDVLIMNEIETTPLALHLGLNVISPMVTAKSIAAKYGMTCIVTLGKKGAVACSPQGVWEVDAMSIEALDTTGAGDAFVGVLAASIEQEMELQIALRRASIASGLACLKKGAQTSLPTHEEVDANLNRVSSPRRMG
jgi:ribokinase